MVCDTHGPTNGPAAVTQWDRLACALSAASKVIVISANLTATRRVRTRTRHSQVLPVGRRGQSEHAGPLVAVVNSVGVP